MPKLSEPQKRMLKVLWQHRLHVEIYTWQDGYQEAHWVAADLSLPRRMHRPNVRTLQSLERKGLLKRGPKGVPSFRLVLTAKGCKVAKELLDAEAE